jgi:hypothetical protein
MRVIVSVVVLGFMAACTQKAEVAGDTQVSADNSALATYVIGIRWSETDDCQVAELQLDPGVECDATPEKICVQRGDFIKWVSLEPPGTGFSIHFDPIQGMPLKAPTGQIKRPIDDDAPIADYKYSIVKNGCDPNGDNTYDPHIRVED